MRQRGFTLIELMIVVVIIGILATLATYSVRSYVRSSRTVEAREVLASLMGAEEAFFDETFRYLSITPDMNTYYPSDDLNGRVAIQWGAEGCSGCLANIRTLGVQVAQPTLFRYSGLAGMPGGAAPTAGQFVSESILNLPGSASVPYYVVKAVSDLDGDGTGYSVFVGSSFQAQLYVEEQPPHGPGE